MLLNETLLNPHRKTNTIFRYAYKVRQTSKPDVITLSPTAGTYAKAFMPSFVLGVLFVAAPFIAELLQKKRAPQATDPNKYDTFGDYE